MNLRIKKTDLILKGLILLLVCALYKFFFLFESSTNIITEGVYGGSLLTVLIISILIIIWRVLRRGFDTFKTFFIAPIFLLEFVLIIEIILTSNSSAGTSKAVWFMVLLTLYLAITATCKKSGYFEYFAFLLQIGSIITCILVILQAFIVNSGGSYFLHIHFIESGSWYVFRNDRLRIVENESLYLLSFAISTVYLRYSSSRIKKMVSLINIVTLLLYNVYVSQTRMILIIEVILVAFAFFWRASFTIRRMVIIMVLIPLIFFLVYSFGDMLFGSLTVSFSDRSFTIRITEYGYFLQQGIEHFPLGVGLGNSMVNYYASDVGIVGVIGSYGFIAAILICYIYFSFYFKRLKSKAKIEIGQLCMFYSIMLMMLCCSPLYNVLEEGQLHVFALEIAILECLISTNIPTLADNEVFKYGKKHKKTTIRSKKQFNL